MGITGTNHTQLEGVNSQFSLQGHACQQGITVIPALEDRDWISIVPPIQVIAHNLKVSKLIIR